MAAASRAAASTRSGCTTTWRAARRCSSGKGVNGTGTLVFAPDGKTLASMGTSDNTIRLHDPVKGSELRQIVLQANNAAPDGTVIVFGGRGNGGNGGGVSLAFSPDSRTLVVQTPVSASQGLMIDGQPQANTGPAGAVRMWDVATGKQVRKIAMPAERGGASIAVAPDGRVLAAENSDGTVSLWEIASGRERGKFGKAEAVAQPNPGMGGGLAIVGGGFGGGGLRARTAAATVAFSPDGSLMACKGAENSIRVWDVAAGKEIGVFKGHQGPIAAIAFAPDGKSLASGSSDTTLLVWDVAGLKRESLPPTVDLPAQEVAERWADLLTEDAGKAFQSIRRLATSPKQVVPFLRERVKPAVGPDPKKLARLIADLDSEDFEERSVANDELERLGELAVPALENVLKSKLTLEARRAR